MVINSSAYSNQQALKGKVTKQSHPITQLRVNKIKSVDFQPKILGVSALKSEYQQLKNQNQSNFKIKSKSPRLNLLSGSGTPNTGLSEMKIQPRKRDVSVNKPTVK